MTTWQMIFIRSTHCIVHYHTKSLLVYKIDSAHVHITSTAFQAIDHESNASDDSSKIFQPCWFHVRDMHLQRKQNQSRCATSRIHISPHYISSELSKVLYQSILLQLHPERFPPVTNDLPAVCLLLISPGSQSPNVMGGWVERYHWGRCFSNTLFHSQSSDIVVPNSKLRPKFWSSMWRCYYC